MSTLELFDHLKGITSQKTPFDPENSEHTKNYIPFLISRFVSMCDIWLPFVNELNKYMGQLRKQDHRLFFWALLPQQYIRFNYIKKKKDISLEDKKLIAQYFKFGTRDAEAAVNMLTIEQIQQIKNMYTHGQV